MNNILFSLLFIVLGHTLPQEAKLKTEISCVTYKIGRILNESPKTTSISAEIKEHFAEI